MKHIIFSITATLTLCLFLLIGQANADVATTEYLYTTYYDTGALSIIDTGTNLQVNSAPINFEGRDIVASPNGDKLYVAAADDNQLLYVNPITNIITKTISLPDPCGVAVSKDNTKVFVSLYDDSKIAVINTATGAIEKYITVGGEPRFLVINDDGTKMYVSCLATTSIYVVDLTTETVTGTMSLGTKKPYKMALNNDNSLLYVISHNNDFANNGTIYAFNTATNAQSTNFTTDIYPYALDIDSYDNIYIGIVPYNIGQPRQYLKYDSTNTLKNRVSVPYDALNGYDYPVDLIVSGNGVLYVAHGSSVSAFDRMNNTLITTVYTSKGNAERMTTVIPMIATTNPYKITVTTFFNRVPLENIRVALYDQNNAFVESKITDSEGSTSFNMETGLTYTVVAYSADENINSSRTITANPSDVSYQISVPFEDYLGLTSVADQFLNTTSQGKVNYYTTVGLDIGTNTGVSNTFYEDTGFNTRQLTVSLYKNNTSLGGSPSFVEYSYGSVALDGNGYVNLNSIPGGIHNNNAYVIEITVNASPQTNKVYVEGSSLSNNQLFQLCGADAPNNDKLRVYVRDDDNTAKLDITSNAEVFDNTPHRIKWEDNNGTYKLYIDDTLDYSGSYVKNQLTVDRYTIGALGRASYSAYYIGDIDDARFWNTSTPSTTKSELTGAEPGLKAYYKFNGDSTDSSIYGYDGSLVNGGGYSSIYYVYPIAALTTSDNAAGNSYYIRIDALQNDDTTKTYYTPFAFPGPTVQIPGFQLEWYWWLAFIPALFLFGMGTITKKGIAGLIGMIWAYIANYWNWFSLYVPQWGMYIIITFGVLICFAVIILEAERYRA